MSARAEPMQYVASAMGSLASLDVPLGPRTTYRVGGRADLLVEARSEHDLSRLADALAGAWPDGVAPVMVMGKGSNTLVADAGFRGVVVVLGRDFDWVSIKGTNMSVGGATSLPVAARQSATAGLSGLEWAVGVPGSIGGAVRMNAGGHGSDMAAVLTRYRSIDLATGETVERAADCLELGYRSSSLKLTEVVLQVDLELVEADPDECRQRIAEVVAWRRANQPGGSNAGSVFTNPVGDSAGRLIDAAGMKGRRIGTAVVSKKHANFIQVDDGGSADDVWTLVDVVRREVMRRFGVELVAELRMVGDFVPSTSSRDGGL